MLSPTDRMVALLRLIQAKDVVVSQIAGELSAVHGLAMNEVLMMMQLDAAPGCRLTRVDLARRLHLSPATVTRMANPMEKIGLVSRVADERDARLAFVQLTEVGRQRIEDVKATFQKRADRFFDERWKEEDVAALSALLGRFVVNTPGDLSAER